jgi:hypothetical protein
MVNRIKVILPQVEYSGLLELADKDLRTPNEQLRFLLRQELVRRGLLNSDVEAQSASSLLTSSASTVQG